MTGFSVIVPVRNEGARIACTAATLLDGLPADAELIFVLNGCCDDSETRLKEVAGNRAVIVHSPAGKTAALNTGDQIATRFPRFYVDADVEISGRSLAILADCLSASGAMLVSPRLEHLLHGASRAARMLNLFWLSLPHAAVAAFHQVIGVTETARARWDRFPDIIADDSFMVAAIPPGFRLVCNDVVAQVRPPWTVVDFVRVRSRWRAGQHQLRAMGIAVPYQTNQRSELRRKMASPATAGPAICYTAAVLAGDMMALAGLARHGTWYQDKSTR